MNAMGHDVPTMIGVDHRGLVSKIQKVVPDYMLMGERGMYDMKEMEMQLPENTAPMMAGHGQFGPIGRGGMLTVLKVRKDQKHAEYMHPRPYKFPPGTVAYEWTGTTPSATRQTGAPEKAANATATKRHGPGMSH
jgi:hypothetical protein